MAERFRILAADDSVLNLRLLEMFLTRAGFTVSSTSHGPEVLPLALDVKPDLILLDLMMPGLSGLEVLGLLKAHPDVASVPVLMATARTLGADVRDALEAGAFDYLKKPLDELETIARVRSALRFKAQQDELTRQATRDSLTGLYNHGLLLELLGRELAVSARTGVPVSYGMVDIDRFKRVNDEWGHQVGDQALKDLGQILCSGVRRTDTVGRYGGEEFGVVLPGCPPGAAATLCDRLRRTTEGHQLTVHGSSFGFTISLGLATALEGESAEQLVSRADRALYEAKESGRNRLVVAR